MMQVEPTSLESVPIALQHAEIDDAVISVRDVSKMYRIYDRPQDRLKQMLLHQFGRNYGHEFWALSGINFEVRRGEAIGIIGRNGSGKSTLLQIIAGTLAPTKGKVTVKGRIAALLELGSGFNPEFTGRENVFLNGSILGINRTEMEQRFDDIAAFADIGEFLDQPVKLYSSGMIVRLAFAVQAHLEPEVLIVDEALSVGDIYFQHKCMRQIKRLVSAGTSLLFVSHDTATIKRFCNSAVWLDGGQQYYSGDAGVAVERYLSHMRMQESRPTDITVKQHDEASSVVGSGITQPDSSLHFRYDPHFADVLSPVERYGTGGARLVAIELLDEQSLSPVTQADFNQRLLLRLHAERLENVGPRIEFSFIVRDRNRIDLFGTTTIDEHVRLDPNQRCFVVEFGFTMRLGPGSYSITAAVVECSEDLHIRVPLDQIDISSVFTVTFSPDRPVWYMFFEPVTMRVNQIS